MSHSVPSRDLRALLRLPGPVFLDGAMGTMLEGRGVPDRCVSNLTNPAAVIQVHRDYFDAGCHVSPTR